MEHRGEAEARRLEAAIERLVAEAQRLGDEGLYRSPAEGEWTAMETLSHLVEIQPYWAGEVQRVAAQPGVAFGRGLDDPGRLAGVQEHAGATLESLLPRLRAATEQAASMLRSLSADDWAKRGMHPRRGEMEIAEIVEHFLIGHAEEHVEQALKAAQAARG